jgi:hypothetical protein
LKYSHVWIKRPLRACNSDSFTFALPAIRQPTSLCLCQKRGMAHSFTETKHFKTKEGLEIWSAKPVVKDNENS